MFSPTRVGGATVGRGVGEGVGRRVGAGVGTALGDGVGTAVGSAIVGRGVGAGLGKAVAPGRIVISGGCSTIGAVGADVGEGDGMAVAPGKGSISGGKNTIAAVGVDVGGDVEDGVRIATPTMGVGAGVIVRTALGEAVGRVVAGSLCGEGNPIAGVGAVVVAPLSTCGV